MIGGFAILEAPSLQAAIEMTKRFLLVHGDAWESSAKCVSWTGPSFGSESGDASNFSGDGFERKRQKLRHLAMLHLPSRTRIP